jgi:hypothetical protein
VSIIKNLKDPKSNLPFSAAFQGQSIAGTGGSFTVPSVLGRATLYPTSNLVRGGMGELVAKVFKCYFMMNPEQINISAGINTDMLSPFMQSADFWKSGGYWVSNQTITFTLYFNRMYEVWQGATHGETGLGPSDEGCRWDIRALERLMGVFDAASEGPGSGTPGGTTGLGNNGQGAYPASQLPLQIVFGGDNSIQFQGVITSLDYTYTLFDKKMVPVEAYADVSVMRVYQPSMSGKDLVSSLITQTGQVGPQKLPSGTQFTQ